MVTGANAECNEPLCCRASSGPAMTPGGGAGRWGDYRKCDTPKRTIDHMLKHIADTHTVCITTLLIGAGISNIPTQFYACIKI